MIEPCVFNHDTSAVDDIKIHISGALHIFQRLVRIFFISNTYD